MAKIEDNIEIIQKADLFFIKENSNVMMNAQQFMQTGEQLAKQKAQLEFELNLINKKLEAFEKHKKVAQELFLKEIRTKAEKAKEAQNVKNKKR